MCWRGSGGDRDNLTSPQITGIRVDGGACAPGYDDEPRHEDQAGGVMTTQTPIVILRTLTYDECQQVRIWRDDPQVAKTLRTGPKTVAEQARFYAEIVCACAPREHIYFALTHEDTFVGMGGLTYLSRWPDEGEISLLIGPPFQRQGLGRAAVQALLSHAFDVLGLAAVVGESYRDADNWPFWEQLALEHGWQTLFFGRSFFFRIPRPSAETCPCPIA